MTTIEKIKSRFKEIDVFEKSAKRVFITVADKEKAKELLRYLVKDLGARLATASGVDTRPEIEIIYHMNFDKENLLVNVRALVKKPELVMPSLTDFLPGAEWVEREIHEMFGVKFSGHPRLEPLLLPDDWPEGVYPLRKKTFDSANENEVREN